ncbi:hypothetical protein RB2654_14320 [Rhodobacterales bacterium HTCC2654]|uniref:Uncharacterized protein n=1 Tax=Maritimibacter alkaliphilus HTCC2654 TaxID=314271 RepID=A3VGR3_9RHOB|nr:hypothetical protein RB2654_14320 [Rhodobacterales bacterium HTCC2654] [Maritimibacter alkaliphilus HTCC2654]
MALARQGAEIPQDRCAGSLRRGRHRGL